MSKLFLEGKFLLWLTSGLQPCPSGILEKFFILWGLLFEKSDGRREGHEPLTRIPPLLLRWLLSLLSPPCVYRDLPASYAQQQPGLRVQSSFQRSIHIPRGKAHILTLYRPCSNELVSQPRTPLFLSEALATWFSGARRRTGEAEKSRAVGIRDGFLK